MHDGREGFQRKMVQVWIAGAPGQGLWNSAGGLRVAARQLRHRQQHTRADMCRRLGKTADARESYEKALALARQEPERRFLARRLRELE